MQCVNEASATSKCCMKLELLHSLVLPATQVKVWFWYLLLRLKRTWRKMNDINIHYTSKHVIMKQGNFFGLANKRRKEIIKPGCSPCEPFPRCGEEDRSVIIDYCLCLLTKSNSLWRWKVCMFTVSGFTWMCQAKGFFFFFWCACLSL